MAPRKLMFGMNPFYNPNIWTKLIHEEYNFNPWSSVPGQTQSIHWNQPVYVNNKLHQVTQYLNIILDNATMFDACKSPG